MNDFDRFMASIEAPSLKARRPFCSMGADGCLGVSIEHHVEHIQFLQDENDTLRRLLNQEARRRATAWLIAAVAVSVAVLAVVIR